MDHEYLTCPLCGFEFDRSDTLCAHGCPLGAMCNLVRCPSCSYEFAETPQKVSWFGKLFAREPAAPSLLPVEVHAVTDLKRGDRAEVLCLGGKANGREDRLAAFGLTPGAEITVLQLRPSCVLKVDETELALDPEIAAQILVRVPAKGAA